MAPDLTPHLLHLLLTQSPPEAPSLLCRLQVEGGVDAYSAYNLNRPDSDVNFLPGTGTTARRHDEITVNLASLGVNLAPEPVGFHVLLGFGTGIDVLHRAEPEEDATGPEVWRYVQQASLSFARGPLTLEAGLYPSHIGFESFQLKATDAVSIAATADVGRQARPGTSAALWYAAGANVRVQVAEPVAVTARAEVYRDREGLLSGTPQTLSEGTLTLEVRPAEHLVLKAEARHDHSTQNVFDGPARGEQPPLPRQHQTLFVVGAVATF
ncbi:outer membrane beta-barrel protein [Corallococcus exiguus]|uniref:outer membrane beta-barrel protein n=1 Tax=Corallococcus TaxID=83461 RepID=UPI000EF078CE|nr:MULTISPECIES: outer membrane beta-barrel protein [Corallococcus]NNB86547.1 outer membrane beta-barrel protein [Corallococcus exiguus]NNB92740.1 outer membrane beta-barrel protein [Corallococcus exiguus]NNC05893.1 outer membrane beta-barrel protein [Corallococcus exiguus]NPC49605.1 outer membrane beta-barrel protein [Corallococcus exiguus]RKH77928.1 porin [Corallococcus sp. AB032C]